MTRVICAQSPTLAVATANLLVTEEVAMPRIAYAARTLLEQVQGDVVGDPDGFGVHRTVMISAQHESLDQIEKDRRVRDLVVVGTELGDVALVSFVTGREADLTDSFRLDA